MEDAFSAIGAPLTAWFEENKRRLPWREDKKPYHVWVSEIMLQQTRIEAVMRYYARFMDALPDVESLSRVDEDRLLKLWEGLGYYSRARNLKRAAVCIMDEHGGVFPQRYEDIRKLPGVGDYTAGAIASICFNERVPAVDGNVLRVIARVTGSRDNVLLPQTKKAVTALLRTHMPKEAGAFNEGLMELGERVCLPNGAPDCAACPIAPHCTALHEGTAAELPVRVKRQKRRREEKTVLLLVAASGEIAVEKRGAQGLLAGMYQLPNTEGYAGEAEIADMLRRQGLTPLEIQPLGEAKHVFTHIEWMMRGVRVRVAEPGGGYLWTTEDGLKSTYALPTAFQKIIRLHKTTA